MTKKPARELFASPDDVVKAHQIVEEELGSGFDVDYTAFPKNKGNMGDSGVLANSVLIIPETPKHARVAYNHGDVLGKVSLRICNETGAASKVLIDITPDRDTTADDPEATRL